MSLIEPLKFRTWKTGHLKMPHFETPRLQTAVFQMVITVASELEFVHNRSLQSFRELINLMFPGDDFYNVMTRVKPLYRTRFGAFP